MPNTKHAIVRLDIMSGTYDGSLLKSAKFYNDVDKEADIDNANLVKLGALLTGEREIFKATKAADAADIKEIGLVASPEVIYDESVRHGLEDYYNEAGKAIRVYRLHDGDIFSATAEAFDNTPALNDYVTVGTGTKMATQAAAPSGVTVGKIINIETVGPDTYYVVQVAL